MAGFFQRPWPNQIENNQNQSREDFHCSKTSSGGLTDLFSRCLFNLPPKIGPGVVIHPLTPRPPKGPPFDT